MFSLPRLLTKLGVEPHAPGLRKADEATRARRACLRFLGRVRTLERLSSMGVAAASAAALFLSVAALGLVLDWVAAPPALARSIALAGAIGLGLSVGLALLVRAGLRRPSDRRLAQETEARYPSLDGRLVTVVSYQGKVSAAVDALAPGVARELQAASAREVYDRRPLRRTSLVALAATVTATLALLAYGRLAPEQLGRLCLLGDEPGPEAPVALLAVRPGAARLHENETLAVEVGVAGDPHEAYVAVRPTDPRSSQDEVRVPLERKAAGRFAAVLPAFVEDATYRAVVDGSPSVAFPVSVVHAPRVVAVAHREEFPGYLEVAARDVPGGDVDVPEGTRVVVRATTSSDPVKGRLRLTLPEEGLVETVALVASGARTLEGSFVARHAGNYRLDYEDATGLSPREGALFTVSVRPDLPPRVAVLAPAADRELSYTGSFDVEYEAGDDHGLGEVSLQFVVKGGKARKLVLPLACNARHVKGRVTVSPRALGLLPGDSAVYFLAAEDRKAPVPNRSASAPFVVAVEENRTLRQALTSIDAADDDALRGVEDESATAPETDADLARHEDALNRLEKLMDKEPASEDESRLGDDPAPEVSKEELEQAKKALEDLDLNDESTLQPDAQDCPDCQKAAEGAGKCQKCGKQGKCGSCGKPGHGRGCEAPDGDAGQKGGDPAGKKGPRGRDGKRRVQQSREAANGARRSVLSRAPARREIVKAWRELLERRRELLRRLAAEVALGRGIPDELVPRLGPDAARLLDALSASGEGAGAAPGAEKLGKGGPPKGFAPSRRGLKVREDIPEQAVELAPRSERSQACEAAPLPTRAPGWDEQMPEELREVVRAYFKGRS